MIFGRRKRGMGVLSLLAIALLAGCGGGGGGSSGGHADFPDPGGGGGESVRLTWTAPTQQVGGACLSASIDEYRISYGNSSGLYEHTASADAAQVDCRAIGRDSCGEVLECGTRIGGLAPAPWYFAVRAVDGLGNVSEYSNEAVWAGPR